MPEPLQEWVGGQRQGRGWQVRSSWRERVVSQVKAMATGDGGWREIDVDLEFTHMLVGQGAVREKTESKMTSRFCAWVSECVGGHYLRLRTEHEMRKQAWQVWGADDNRVQFICSLLRAQCSGHPSGDVWVWSLGLNL